MFAYRKATLEDLETLWNRHIAENPKDDRYLRWKRDFIERNRLDQAATFVVVRDGEPVGEVTLAHHQNGTRSLLADGKSTGYIQALRIRKEYEGQGHVSRLMRALEAYARELGYSTLTIGVEATETRTLGMYLHWGYDQFLMSEMDDGELVLFYAKDLS